MMKKKKTKIKKEKRTKKKKKNKNKNKMEEEKEKKTLWSIIAKNTDCSTRPPARPFACLLAPLTRSLALDCSLRSRPPLRSLTSLARSLRSHPHSWDSDLLDGYFVCVFFHFRP